MRRHLHTAFETAAVAAASNRASFKRGDFPAQILHRERLLKEWAEAGIKEVDKMSEEQLDVGWVYGMLELLKRLTTACNQMQPDDEDKSVRQNLLLVRAD